ncbi:MAG TPA: hypothetical protein VLZ82_01865 [Microbacterium sp.]|nr:hypothetical protein [Microbacterium sp.]
MITSTLVMPVIAISTLSTIIFIGLGFLARPSQATATWAAAFAAAMVGSYVWLAQDFAYPAELRAVGSGLAVASMPLLWSGLRAFRDQRRRFIPLSVALMALTPAALLVSTHLGVYGVAFRVAFSIMAIFAVLTVVELVRLGPQRREETIPLIGVSVAFVVFAAITIINGSLVAGGHVASDDSLQFIRSINLIGMSVYLVCTLVTLLLLTHRSDAPGVSPHGAFERIASNRLSRARAAGDQWWSLLDIRLDDADDIRLATSAAAFDGVCERFARDLDSVLPADADIERMNPTCFVVLLPRPNGSIRELLTELLERVSTPDDAPTPVRLSASAGWAGVSVVGYDFEALVTAASQAAQTAQADGGDRWVRVSADDGQPPRPPQAPRSRLMG